MTASPCPVCLASDILPFDQVRLPSGTTATVVAGTAAEVELSSEGHRWCTVMTNDTAAPIGCTHCWLEKMP